MVRPWERVAGALCYVGALRVVLVALLLPGWAFTLPTGLLTAGGAWLYGRKRSPFLLHHGREGFRWTLQANLILAAISLLAMALYRGWEEWELLPLHSLWIGMAMVARWVGALLGLVTLLIMGKAARGQTGDLLCSEPLVAGPAAQPVTPPDRPAGSGR